MKDFKVVPFGIISSGQSKSKPGAFPGFRCCWAAANTLEAKSPATFTGLVVGAF